MQKVAGRIEDGVRRVAQRLTLGLPPDQASVVWSAAFGIPDEEVAGKMGIPPERLAELQTQAAESIGNRFRKK